jgi:GT2 family glycosyltransferase
MMGTPVAIAILNYNGKHWLEQFLPSVSASLIEDSRIVVIDNGSTDDSATFIQHHYPKVEWLPLNQNLGFCGGYNRGLAQIPEEYVLLLNSDVEVDPSFLPPLIQALEKDERLAAVQPKIKSFANRNLFEYAGAAGGFIDQLGYPFCRGRILNQIEEDNGQYNNPITCFWASGAAMLLRKSLFIQAGGFDERFFAHMEEIDLCWRFQRMGYQVACIPESIVYHVGGGTLQQNSPRKIFFNHRNNLLMLTKNLPFLSKCLILPIRFVLDGLSGIGYLVQGNPSWTWSVIKAHGHVYQSIFTPSGRYNVRGGKKNKLRGFYSGFLLVDYFIRKKNRFNLLNNSKLN